MSQLRTPLGVWILRIDFDACRRVHANAGYDILAAIDDQSILELYEDLGTLSAIVWELVEPTARRRGITAAQFLESIAGEGIDAMAQAFVEAVAEFLPEPDSDSAYDEDRPRPSTDREPDREPLRMLLCKAAARIPIEPGPYTARELFAMAAAACSERWDHTAAQLFLLSAIHRAPNTRPTPYTEFHPYLRPKRRGMTVAQLHAMKATAEHVVTITLAPESTNEAPAIPQHS